MKKLLTIILYISGLFLLLLSGHAFAQNPELPSAPCKIILKNKGFIKDARLWEIYPNRIEYEKEGSLHDLLIEEIERIVTDNEIITFEQDGKLFKQSYSEVKTTTDKLNTNYNKSNVVYSERPQYAGRPTIDGGRVAGEIFAGVGLGIAGGLGGVVAGALLGSAAGGPDGLFNGAAIGAVIGAPVGYILGAAGGVQLAGSTKDVKGSYGAALGGATLGAIGGVAVIVAAQGNITGVVIAALLPPIGATVAFNSTRRYKSSGTANSINLGFNQNGVLLTYKF